jgi:hypothetical protein
VKDRKKVDRRLTKLKEAEEKHAKRVDALYLPFVKEEAGPSNMMVILHDPFVLALFVAFGIMCSFDTLCKWQFFVLLHGKVETTFAQCFPYDLPPECLDLADPSLPICDYKVPIVGYGNRDMDWTDVGQDLYDAQLKELNEEYPIQ